MLYSAEVLSKDLPPQPPLFMDENTHPELSSTTRDTKKVKAALKRKIEQKMDPTTACKPPTKTLGTAFTWLNITPQSFLHKKGTQPRNTTPQLDDLATLVNITLLQLPAMVLVSKNLMGVKHGETLIFPPYDNNTVQLIKEVSLAALQHPTVVRMVAANGVLSSNTKMSWLDEANMLHRSKSSQLICHH